MQNFKDKITVITGAGSGIGRALALAFGKRGAQLALNDFDSVGLAETSELLRQQGVQNILTSAFDVADRKAMNDFAQSIKEQWGNAHIIINNAGIAGSADPAYLTEYESYRRVMEVNFFGVLNGCQAFLPHLVANNEGAVVNISSIFGLVGTPNCSDYSASKFAVRGYTESLAVEFHQSPIGIHCVHPGGINTNIANESDPDFAAKFLTTPPEDLAKHIIKGVQKKKPKIVYGRDALSTWIGANLVPQKLLNKLIWNKLKVLMDIDQYRTFTKGL